MVGLGRWGAWGIGALLAGCGPTVPIGGSEADPGSTGGAEAAGETGGSGSPTSSGGVAESGGPGGTGTSGTGDGSHDTDYPVDPGCDESDESWGEYDEDETGGSGSSGGAEDTGIGMGGDFPLSATVYEIRTGQIAGGEFVQLTDVVVTAPPVLATDGADKLLFVQEPEGGPNSGINIHFSESTPERDALVPGDRVTVRGYFYERYVFAALWLDYDDDALEIGTPGPVPAPVLVTPEMVSAGGELAASLESVLVEIEQAEVVDPMACPGQVLVQATLKIDDRFLAAQGLSLPAPASGVYTRVAGPLIYTYNGFEIAPRSLADLGL